MKTHKTAKGTLLPLLNLKGKDYLAVQQRILWFREELPTWGIETEVVSLNEKHAVFKATIKNEQGRIMAQATKSETPQGFADFIEKAETGAIGRALALVGFGTQFAIELDEGERIVDAPAPTRQATVQQTQQASNNDVYVVKFGKYKGQAFLDIPADEACNYAMWLKDNSRKTGKEISKDGADFIAACEFYHLKRPEVATQEQDADIPF